ncbi:acetyltransferase [Acetivibrio cellulolyticus]|uniref:acetyltransferase n=1 Tax=Acetivibrio cellulolyticus TaxID=35830 RepID=UPI0001E2E34E|nr:acetyltransferase [Acetivibrio cellulolyticus]
MEYGDKDLVVIGAGGHARVIIDILTTYYEDFNIIGVLDKDSSKHGSCVDGYYVIGDDSILEELFCRGLRNAVMGLGMMGGYAARRNVCEIAGKIGFKLLNIVHGNAVISKTAVMGTGNVVMANAVINTGVSIGNNCIINTGSIVEHGCIIGDNTHIASGAKLAGDVKIGTDCLIGLGANIIQGIAIGDGSIIGAGSVVLEDIPPDSVSVGVPARVIKRRKQL